MPLRTILENIYNLSIEFLLESTYHIRYYYWNSKEKNISVHLVIDVKIDQ